jgi:hypothetical protein
MARRGGRGLPADRLMSRTPPPVVELAARCGVRRVSGGGWGRCLSGLCRDGSTDIGVMYPLLAATCPGRRDLACRAVVSEARSGQAVSAGGCSSEPLTNPTRVISPWRRRFVGFGGDESRTEDLTTDGSSGPTDGAPAI